MNNDTKRYLYNSSFRVNSEDGDTKNEASIATTTTTTTTGIRNVAATISTTSRIRGVVMMMTMAMAMIMAMMKINHR